MENLRCCFCSSVPLTSNSPMSGVFIVWFTSDDGLKSCFTQRTDVCRPVKNVRPFLWFSYAYFLFPIQIRGARSRALHDRAIINCQYSMATFSTAERKRRPHGDRKSTEMSLHLKQTFEAAVLTQLYPRSQIDIYVKVGLRFIVYCALLHSICFCHCFKNVFIIQDSSVRRGELQRLCERRHTGSDRRRDPDEGLCVRLHSGLRG